MTLKEVIVQDVAEVFQNEDEFAETIEAVEPDGTSHIVVAIVFADTQEDEFREDGRYDVNHYRVFVSLADVPGITHYWHLIIDAKRYAILQVFEDDRIGGLWLRTVRSDTAERSNDGFRRPVQ